MEGFAGVTTRKLRLAFVTVKVALPETEPDWAVMVLEPAATADAIPMVPLVLLMVATPGADEVQLTELVKFCVL
jgi:hypothetical protein